MFSSKWMSQNQFVTALSFIIALAMIFSLAIVSTASAASGLNVYVISTNNPITDEAIFASLSSAGYHPFLGVTVDAFDGSQSLNDFDAVVLVYHEWTKNLPPGGQTALVDFVSNGGGLVTGEWTIWAACVGDVVFLEPILPATGDSFCSYYNTPPDTTNYEQVTADVILNHGVDSSFNITLGDVDGTEQVLLPKPGATVFYNSSQTGYAGVVGWNYGAGRAISYSTLISDVELGNTDYNQLFINSILWTVEGKYVDIDIKPGSYPNSINLRSRGVVSVAVLTTDDFDSSKLDPASVVFADAPPLRWAIVDVDFDGDMDSILHFKVRELNLDESSTEAILSGKTFDGISLFGKDDVQIVPIIKIVW